MGVRSRGGCRSVKDEAEAVASANDSVFGLGGGVITRDLAEASVAAEMIESGCVSVSTVRSDPRPVRRGEEESGYGRELSGYGIKVRPTQRR